MATATTPRAGSRPWGPAVVQLGLTVGLAVLLAAITLTTRQPPPPAIAEFAPQAAEQIKEQPKEQSSQFGSGSGPGDCPPGAKCDPGQGAGVGAGGPGGSGSGGGGTTTTAPKIGAPTLKHCVGNPPRQIEDPQSPPCIAYWDDSKGNGGATAPGVTADTIKLAVSDEVPELESVLAQFFNKRFQLYGRSIQLVKVDGSGAAAADAAKQNGVFAALPRYSDIPYYRELAHHKIIGTYRTNDFSDSELAANVPYLWGYTMSFSQMMSALADWACRRLVGYPAAHAGTSDTQPMSTKPRRFAVFLDMGTPDATVTTEGLVKGIEACGGSVPFATTYARFDNDTVRTRNEVTQMKADGVTTAFCLCVSTNLATLQTQAEAQAYQPEWIISSYPQLVLSDGGYSGSQMNRTFGVSFGPMDRVREDHPQIWALNEMDPSNVNATSGAAQPTPVGSVLESNDLHYRGFLLLAAGLQMAGPNLTPETFRQGLQRARFPNPDHPIMAGTVGFEGDLSMTNDAAEFWWSESDPSPYTGHGPTFCWVDGGRRHVKGTWPKAPPPLFKGPCDSGNRSVS